jgi:hypothetical protein
MHEVLYEDRAHSAFWSAYKGDFSKELTKLENQLQDSLSAKNYFALADFLYFKSYWLSAAIPLIEKGLALDPKNSEYRWRLIDLYMNNADYEPMLTQYQTLHKQSPNDEKLNSSYDFYLKMFELSDNEVSNFVRVSQNLFGTEQISETHFVISEPPKAWPPQKLQDFPDLQFMDAHSRLHRLSELRGRWVLIEPIGMNCPACLAFSGAHKYGSLKGIEPQKDLLSIQDYLTQAKIDVQDKRLQLVQLLLYDLDMKGPTIEDAFTWRHKFNFGKGDGHWVIAGGQKMMSSASYDMIPGYYLLDTNGVVVADATGHHPKDSLFTELIPLLKKKLENKRSLTSDEPPSLEQIIALIGQSPIEAYRLIPHQRTVFLPESSVIDETSKAQVEQILQAVDVAVALRVRLLNDFNNGKLESPRIQLYNDLIHKINSVQSPNLEHLRSLLVKALTEQRDFFNESELGKTQSNSPRPDIASNTHVNASSSQLHAAYSELLRLFPKENAHNKQAFFDYLCALDFL